MTPTTFRALTPQGDWLWGYGLQSYFQNVATIQADIATALKVFLGECFFDTTLGVDWLNLIGGKNPIAQANIILQSRTVIIGRPGVTAINSVTANLQGRALSVSYSINTIFTKNVTGTVTLP